MKQDRQAVRTASELERKYNFGKTFAEAFGLVKEAQDAAARAENTAESAKDAVEALDHEAIFNLLTNNGELQGLYKKDGKLYINAELVQIVNLIADHLKSVSDNRTMEISSGRFEFSVDDLARVVIEANTFGTPQIWIPTYDENGDSIGDVVIRPGMIGVNSTFPKPGFAWMEIDEDTGKGTMQTDVFNGKSVSWKDNGDGTFTLIGV